jgi:head-tail adaptor
VSAGRRYVKIHLQRATVTQDGAGEETPVWADTSEEWAAVFYGRGDERRQAAMEQGQQAATFQVPSNAATRATRLKDRLVFDETGAVWDVVGVSLDTPKRGKVEITATATGETAELEAES